MVLYGYYTKKIYSRLPWINWRVWAILMAAVIKDSLWCTHVFFKQWTISKVGDTENNRHISRWQAELREKKGLAHLAENESSSQVSHLHGRAPLWCGYFPHHKFPLHVILRIMYAIKEWISVYGEPHAARPPRPPLTLRLSVRLIPKLCSFLSYAQMTIMYLLYTRCYHKCHGVTMGDNTSAWTFRWLPEQDMTCASTPEVRHRFGAGAVAACALGCGIPDAAGKHALNPDWGSEWDRGWSKRRKGMCMCYK